MKSFLNNLRSETKQKCEKKFHFILFYCDRSLKIYDTLSYISLLSYHSHFFSYLISRTINRKKPHFGYHCFVEFIKVIKMKLFQS